MFKSIPLDKLVPSPRNVRRSTDKEADRQLTADIEARGLLQNLVVSATTRPRGRFAVEAGGRRLAALQRLVEDGKLSKNHEVCCLVLEGSCAESCEASLAENFQRLSMNPADECRAFEQLIEQGSDIESIARRFGLTLRFVEGRLRLAALSPEIFAALGAGEISLDIAKAYAATPDRERQSYVFEQMSNGYGGAYPDSIRRMMTQATVSAGDRRARFVGEEAYVAAGGRIERDLFADENDARWLDVAIVERLACDKLAIVAAETATEAGFAWVRPTLDHWIGGSLTEDLRRVPVQPLPLTEQQKVELDALETELDEAALGLEDEGLGDADREAVEVRTRQLRDRIDAIVDRPPVIDDEAKAQCGAFLMLDDQGRPHLDAALYADMSSVGSHDDDAGSTLSQLSSSEPNGRAGGLSQRLVDELSIQRRDILAVHVAADAGLALDLAIFLMVDSIDRFSAEASGSSLSAIPPSNPVSGFATPQAAATIAGAEAGELLDRSWTMGTTRANRFDAFRKLEDEARAAWLGHAMARTLSASLNLAGERSCAFHDHLGTLLGIDVAVWWRPTGTNFFDRVPKRVMLEALAEVGGPAFAERYASAKKAELSQSCERIFAGDFIGEAEIKEAALAWVPSVMHFASASPEAAIDEPAPWEEQVTGPGEPTPNAGDAEPIEQAA